MHAVRQTGGAGLNAAVTQGVTELRLRAARPLLPMSCDLPGVWPADPSLIAAIGARTGGPPALDAASPLNYCPQF